MTKRGRGRPKKDPAEQTIDRPIGFYQEDLDWIDAQPLPRARVIRSLIHAERDRPEPTAVDLTPYPVAWRGSEAQVEVAGKRRALVYRSMAWRVEWLIRTMATKTPRTKAEARQKGDAIRDLRALRVWMDTGDAPGWASIPWRWAEHLAEGVDEIPVDPTDRDLTPTREDVEAIAWDLSSPVGLDFISEICIRGMGWRIGHGPGSVRHELAEGYRARVRDALPPMDRPETIAATDASTEWAGTGLARGEAIRDRFIEQATLALAHWIECIRAEGESDDDIAYDEERYCEGIRRIAEHTDPTWWHDRHEGEAPLARGLFPFPPDMGGDWGLYLAYDLAITATAPPVRPDALDYLRHLEELGR